MNHRILLDTDIRYTNPVLKLTLDVFLAVVSLSMLFSFVCCSMVRGCSSQMETAKLIKLQQATYNSAFTREYALKTFSDVSGAVFL